MPIHDLRIAIRSLLRSPALTLAGVLTLAVAIGMATGVFTIVNALLLRPLPYRDAGRLAEIWTVSPNAGRGPISFDDFEDFRRDSKTIQSAAAYTAYYKPVLSGVGPAERLAALRVSHEYFTVVGAQPLLGRFFLPDEDRDGRDNVVVLSHELWVIRFHSDPRVIGSKILLNSLPHTVVGVAGSDLPLLPPSLADEPARIYRPVGEPFGKGSRDGRHLETIVRLRPGVSIDQAQAELNLRCQQLMREHPDEDAKLRVRIVGMRDDLTRNVRGALWSLQGAVLVLMLIACANVANLLLARSSARRRDFAIRSALGAGTGRLARMLLAESLILGIAGGACGLLLADWSTAALSASVSRVLVDAGSISIDPRVLLFSLAVTLTASILFGLVPVLHLDRTGIEQSLKSGLRVAGDHRNRLRQALAAMQIALAFVLLVSAGLLGRSFLHLREANPGFDPRGVLAASVALPTLRYPTDASSAQFFLRALENLRSLPGVRAAAAVSVVPLSGDFDRTSFQISGRFIAAGELQSPDRYIISPSYFETMRIPLRAGRLPDSRDSADRPPVCVISETAARLWFPGESPLGKKIRAGSASGGFDNSPFREVVGVVGDVAQYGLDLPSTPQIYMPHVQYAGRYMSFLVRTDGSLDAVAGMARKVVTAIDPEQPLYDVTPLAEMVANTIGARRLGLGLLAVFALSALILAGIGIYGVVSYSVSQRTPEFGVRMALGAGPSDILRQAMYGTAPMLAAGLAIGVVGSLAVSKLVAGFLFGVRPTDGPTFVFLALFLTLVVAAASYLPARRAAKVDPVSALRSE